MVIEKAYMAIRRDEKGFEFFDVGTLELVEQTVKQLADQADRETPEWAKENSVVRIAVVKITEVPGASISAK